MSNRIGLGVIMLFGLLGDETVPSHKYFSEYDYEQQDIEAFGASGSVCGGFDNVELFPLFIERIPVEKLQTITIDFNGTPRVSLDEAVKIFF